MLAFRRRSHIYTSFDFVEDLEKTLADDTENSQHDFYLTMGVWAFEAFLQE